MLFPSSSPFSISSFCPHLFFSFFHSLLSDLSCFPCPFASVPGTQLKVTEQYHRFPSNSAPYTRNLCLLMQTSDCFPGPCSCWFVINLSRTWDGNSEVTNIAFASLQGLTTFGRDQVGFAYLRSTINKIQLCKERGNVSSSWHNTLLSTSEWQSRIVSFVTSSCMAFPWLFQIKIGM